MLLSVLVPVYNVELYLSRCLNSILAMPMNDYEIILVNDGSKDDSGKICDEFSKKYSQIKVIHQSNKGVVTARKQALKIAKGEYITFVDSDDWVDDKLFSVLVKVLIDHKDIDIAAGSILRDTDNNLTFPFLSMKNKIMKKKEAIYRIVTRKGMHWGLWGKVFKKKLFDNLVIDESVNYYEDFDMIWSLFMKSNKVIFNNRYAYHYYVNPHSITQKRCVLNISSWRVFKRILLDDYNVKPIKQQIANFYMQEFLRHTLEMYFVDCKKYKNQIEEYINELKDTQKKAIVRQNIIPNDDYKKITADFESLKEFYDNIFNELKVLLQNLQNNNYKLYVYGTGIVAQYVTALMKDMNMTPESFIVSDGQVKRNEFMNKPVYYLSEIGITKDTAILLALSGKSQEAVLKILKDTNISNIYYVNFPPIVW